MFGLIGSRKLYLQLRRIIQWVMEVSLTTSAFGTMVYEARCRKSSPEILPSHQKYTTHGMRKTRDCGRTISVGKQSTRYHPLVCGKSIGLLVTQAQVRELQCRFPTKEIRTWSVYLTFPRGYGDRGVWNPTENWTFMFNAAQQKAIKTNVLKSWVKYFDIREPQWLENGEIFSRPNTFQSDNPMTIWADSADPMVETS